MFQWFQTWLSFRKIKLCDDAVVLFVYVVQDLRIAEAFLEGDGNVLIVAGSRRQ